MIIVVCRAGGASNFNPLTARLGSLMGKDVSIIVTIAGL